jgi:hypothetical protein
MSVGTVYSKEEILPAAMVYIGTSWVGMIDNRNEGIFSNLKCSMLDIRTNIESTEIPGV